MSIEEIIIRIRKKGKTFDPDYILIIYGFGKVKFDGIKNVDFIGKKEWNISDEKIIEILTFFKTLKFFALKDNYLIKEDEIQPITTISISLPDENGNILTKNVIYNQKDPSVPSELINLEKKILTTVEFQRFNIKKEEVNEKKIDKKELIINKEKKNIEKKKSSYSKAKIKKIIITIIPIFVIIMFLIGVFYYGLIDLSIKEKNSENSSNFRINQFTTAKKIYGYNNININDSFERDETFYFYIEFADISTEDNSTKCNLEIQLTIKSFNKIIDNIFLKIDEIKNHYNISITPDDSWPLGNYEVILSVIDKISQINLEDTIIFCLNEKSLKITKLLPASYVGGYNNYIYNYSFTLFETVYIYQEYDGFQVDNYGNCDITMEITINVSGNIIYSKSYDEDNGNVKMHKWDILIENNWPINVYIVNVTIKDNLSGKTASKSISFKVL